MKLERAWALVERAVEAGQAQNVKVAVAVVDAGGNQIAGARMDGAGFLALASAIKKARTAATLGHPTQAIATMASKDPIMQSALTGQPEMLLLAGGVPLTDGDELVGAIGVAGAHYLQDQAIADFALAG